MEYSKAFCQNLKYLRQLKNLTQYQVAERLRIDESLYISLEEHPSEAPPSFSLLARLCEFFEVSADALLFSDLQNNEYTILKKYFTTNEIKEILTEIDETISEVKKIKNFVAKSEAEL